MDSGETDGFGNWKLTGILVPPRVLDGEGWVGAGDSVVGTSWQPFPFLWITQEGTKESSQECVCSQTVWF